MYFSALSLPDMKDLLKGYKELNVSTTNDINGDSQLITDHSFSKKLFLSFNPSFSFSNSRNLLSPLSLIKTPPPAKVDTLIFALQAFAL